MTSAPDPTDPSTVTSPSGWKIAWPERIALSTTSDAGATFRRRRRRSWLRPGTDRFDGRRPSPAHQRRQIGAKLLGGDPLHAHDPDAARSEFRDQVRDGGTCERYPQKGRAPPDARQKNRWTRATTRRVLRANRRSGAPASGRTPYRTAPQRHRPALTRGAKDCDLTH